ncbi:MAG: hypothetical protein GY854_10155 [Deltaproteobacteria bacterium]|nr:hypothetical protein [Deltaproteobacteria bacterium]
MKFMVRLFTFCFVWLFICASGCKDNDSKSKRDAGAPDAGKTLDAGIDAGSHEDAGVDSAPTPDNCLPGEAFNPTSKECTDCSYLKCGAEGEVGLHHTTTVTGTCICETAPGYFYSISDQKAAICDADKDGFITIVAKQFYDGNDDALKENTRCYLRTISSVVLEPEDKETDATTITIEPLALYEASARDRDAELALDKSAPSYGGGSFMAQELNSFSKACVNSIADYNANGVPDIEEWEDHDDLKVDYETYARFAYFLELYRGWYEPPSSGESNGSFHIAEKSRAEDADEWDHIPVGAYEHEGDLSYWRKCLRRVDCAYDSENPLIGFDFAWASVDEGAAMYHHSQFKCIQVRSQGEVMDLVDAPHLINGSELEKYIVSKCKSEGNHPPEDLSDNNPDSYNTAQSIVTCEELANTEAGDVGLSLVHYLDYDSDNDYERGCVNECIEYDVWPGLADCEGEAKCKTDIDNFGSGDCGCKGNYSYPGCVDCLPNWDISTGCEMCLGNWDAENNCDTCIAGWNNDSGCMVCDGYWDIKTSCMTCVGNRDETTDCDTCFSDDLNGYWTGDDCDLCSGHWADNTNCTGCQTHWMDDPAEQGSDCNKCPADSTDGYWDASRDCEHCIQRGEIRIPGEGEESFGTNDNALGFWNPTTGCTTCLDLFDEDLQCLSCIPTGLKTENPTACKHTQSGLVSTPENLNPGAGLCDQAFNPICDKWTADTCNHLDYGSSGDSACGDTINAYPPDGNNKFFSFANCNATSGSVFQNLRSVLLTEINLEKIQAGIITKIHYKAHFISCDPDTGSIGIRMFRTGSSVEIGGPCEKTAAAGTDDWTETSGVCSITPDIKDVLSNIQVYVRYASTDTVPDVFFDGVEVYFSVEDYDPPIN